MILGCGTSWHAGYVGCLHVRRQARIPVQVEISSEFRYKNPIVPHGTLVIAISQSGETADTIAAVRELKAKGAKVLADLQYAWLHPVTRGRCVHFLARRTGNRRLLH